MKAQGQAQILGSEERGKAWSTAKREQHRGEEVALDGAQNVTSNDSMFSRLMERPSVGTKL